MRDFSRCLIFVLCAVYASDTLAFTVHGMVMEDFQNYAISGAQIYERYGSDKPVAITDEKGEFTYETADDTPLILVARKKGYVEALGYPKDYGTYITDKDNSSDVLFKMQPFFKPTHTTIYAILDDDKDCILNTYINYSGHCVDKLNNYTYNDLGDNTCTGGGVYPGIDGGFVIPNLVHGEVVFDSQYRGGVMFIETPEAISYYSVPHEDVTIKKLKAKYEYSYDWGKSLGSYKNVSKDEYVTAHLRDFFKFCPKKLMQIKNIKNDYTVEQRIVSGLTTGAMGIGGMQLAQGLAEQSADKSAESDMNEYLSTFQCKVGNNTYSGGTIEIETPGANQLIKLYQEYVDLADDLKKRKAELGIKSGIESQIILDKSHMGLYDDAGHGVENGTYASLYRATRGSEQDSINLADDKDTSANRVKYGTAAAAIGLAAKLLIEPQLEYNKKGTRRERLLEKELEPELCPLQECIDKLTITERTKKTSLYKKVKDFCASEFPNEPDCEKIMLIYSDEVNVIHDIDILKANKYSINYYKEATVSYCDDWEICTPNADSDFTQLFSDYWYNSKENSKRNEEFRNWLKKCFKTAGALDYFDFNTYVEIADNLTIEYDKIDCSKLDEGKTDESIIVRGNRIKPSVAANVDYIKKLLGNQAIYIRSNKQ